jgi:hypothetical protein
MNITEATNKKCPYQFNQAIKELNYCITDLCMSWVGDDQEGHSIIVSREKIEFGDYQKKETIKEAEPLLALPLKKSWLKCKNRDSRDKYYTRGLRTKSITGQVSYLTDMNFIQYARNINIAI